MKNWILLLAAVLMFSGCDKLEDLEPEDDEDEVTREMEQAVSRMETTFKTVSAYHDSLSRICEGQVSVSDQRHQELATSFEQAIADFRRHHHDYHKAYKAADDDESYEDEGSESESSGEGYHDEEDEAYEDDDEDDDDDDENEREDELEDREESLYKQVTAMEANYCAPPAE